MIIFDISIHAPTNGATDKNLGYLVPIPISIHAPTNGATMIAHFYIKAKEFQSTLRRTERRRALKNATIPLNFNPRSDERSDRMQ